MITPIELEARIQNAEKYFAAQMDKIVDATQQISPVNEALVSRVDELFNIIEAINFLFDMGIYMEDATFVSVYKKMMYQIGVYSSNLTLDNTLIQPII